MEEVHGPLGAYLACLNTHGTKADPYQLIYAVMAICRAKKWWEDESSRLMRSRWMAIDAILESDEGKLAIPEYAYDGHTLKGKRLMEKGEADLRFAGHWIGMLWRAEASKAVNGASINDLRWEDVPLNPKDVERAKKLDGDWK